MFKPKQMLYTVDIEGGSQVPDGCCWLLQMKWTQLSMDVFASEHKQM